MKLKHEKETLGFLHHRPSSSKVRGGGEDIRQCDNGNAFGEAVRASTSRSAVWYPPYARCARRKAIRWRVVLLEDWEGIVEVLVFPDTFAKVQRLLDTDAPIFVKGKLDNDESKIKILATDVYPMERVKEMLSRTVTIRINTASAPSDIAERLQPIIDEKRGPAEIVFELEYPGPLYCPGSARIRT